MEKMIRRLTVADEVAFRDFEASLLAEKEQGNTFIETKKVDDFAAFVAKQRQFETQTDNPDWSTSTNYYYFLDDVLVARIRCRWELKGNLPTVGGHIGYVTRPEYRGQGVMTDLLQFALDRYAERGINRVLITALADNIPSRKTIEKAGGVLENIIDIEEGKRLARYWIDGKRRDDD